MSSEATPNHRASTTAKPRELAATLDERSVNPSVAHPKRCAGFFAVDESQGPLTQNTHALLRQRLRAASLMLTIGFGVFLVFGFLPLQHFLPRAQWLQMLHIATVLILGTTTYLLWSQERLCMLSLRGMELVVFGTSALFFLFLTSHEILSSARSTFPHAADPNEPWMLLIFMYNLFIPNRWQRACWVSCCLALMPIGLTVSLMFAYSEVAAQFCSAHLIAVILELALTSAAGTYGSYLMGSLREEVIEARQLGQYKLRQRIGSGGMGEVFLAEHEMLKRPCAIKIIRPQHASDPKSLARFEREVMAMSQLSHWNTVEIYDYGRTEDGTFYYVMEYLPGLSLHDLVEKHGVLHPARVIHLLRQMCKALSEAHSLGMLHRDIKPGNIFISIRGGIYDVVKLLDFGLVKPLAQLEASRLTQEGSVTGTPHFMSPEQASSENVDVRSDLYSLGAVAYFMLTGRPPFESDNPLSLLIAHARDPVIPPSQFQPGIPRDLEEVVLRCLAKKPSDRFPDTQTLLQELENCSMAMDWSDECARRWWAQQEPIAGKAPDRKDLEPAGVL